MAVTLTDVTKRFGGQAAVDGVSVDIADGEFFVVLGPSGCGKSTLLRLVAGLERLDGGRIAVDGATVSTPERHVPPEARGMGVVFQSYALWPHMDVRDNVAFPAESLGRPRRAARDEASAHLATVALTEYADRRPAELSGGQRQRVALARCLAGGARTVLMDEPLANLDPHLRGAMEGEIAAFHARAGATTIFITHDQREAMALATRVAVMSRGRFRQVAPPQALYERPATEEVARFIGRAGILDAPVTGGVATLGNASVSVTGSQLDKAGPARIVIRPENVRLGEGPLAARLLDVFYRGGVWEAFAEVEGLSAPLPVASPRRIVEGERVALDIANGWVLPENSEAPGHDAGRQAASQPVE
ncbi:ABC transporter ATP-binding protein [uncultured Jannaschia sp.]|uniref:ABC transporter ATP-binding protein n=1 Tax=uncultured Jannaschia sp. TaxID=293347 RepID=UPI00260E4817|nr:ABC transporter ATP-binding protein [uncultured Jannaschia sp.]